MKAACGGRFRGFFEYSPTAILATRFSRSIAMSLPPALIVHGTGDETVPFTSSSELAAQLISHGVPTVTWYLHKKDHFASIGMYYRGEILHFCVTSTCIYFTCFFLLF
jgi:predicted esterase